MGYPKMLNSKRPVKRTLITADSITKAFELSFSLCEDYLDKISSTQNITNKYLCAEVDIPTIDQCMSDH